MKRKEFTKKQKDFISENRLKMSINQISLNLEVSFNSVNKYMEEKNLKVFKEKKPKKAIEPKKETIDQPKWVFEIWEIRVNPVTMFKF